MNTYEVLLTITVKAKTQKEAEDITKGALEDKRILSTSFDDVNLIDEEEEESEQEEELDED